MPKYPYDDSYRRVTTSFEEDRQAAMPAILEIEREKRNAEAEPDHISQEAAKALLEASKQALRHLEDPWSKCNNRKARIVELRTAIAKAKGE